MQASAVGTKLIMGAFLLSSAAWGQKIEARALTGTRDDSALGWKAPQSVYASRPGSPFTGQNWIMTDTDCAGTASATPTACRWSGSAWQATGGSGGGGASSSSQLTDFLVTRTDSTHLSINANSNVNINSVVYTFASAVTATISAGTGTLYLYIDQFGTLTCGNNLTMTCSGVGSAVSGVTAFPAQSTPIWTWTATSGTWDTSGGTNKRAFISGGFAGTGGGGSSITCDSGTVPYTSLTAAATTQEITIETALPGLTGFGYALMSETTQFAGGSTTALTVGMGRSGLSPEMSGASLPLKQSSGDANFTGFIPPIPQMTSTYNVILLFTSTGANLNTFTSGVASWRLCHYGM